MSTKADYVRSQGQTRSHHCHWPGQEVNGTPSAAYIEAAKAVQAWIAERAPKAAQPVAGAVAPDETGWLIEHSGEILPGAEQRAQVSWLRVQMKFNGYGAREFGFTHDANEALRFARKEDAEAVLAMHLGASPPDWYSKPFSVTEHMWPAASQAQAAPAPEPSAQGEPVAARFKERLKTFVRFDAEGPLEPQDPFTWETVARCAIDLAIAEIDALASAPSTPPTAVVEAVPLTDAARDVLAERQRQIEELGWLHDHDDEYEQRELAFAASCYAVANSGATVPPEWPWPPEWWKPRDLSRNLVRAAALLLAEIERLDRAVAAARRGAS